MNLTAYYDLKHSPPTYDFLGFLLTSDATRMAFGLPGIDIKILPGPASGFRQDHLPPFDVSERVQMRDNIVVPMASMLPTVESCEVCHDRPKPTAGAYIGYEQNCYGTDRILEAFRLGMFPLRPVGSVEKVGGPYVTITIRNASYWPTRNSNIPEWVRVAEWFEERGYTAIFIQDAGPDRFVDVPFQSMDTRGSSLLDRAAVYSQAALNMFVNNGPAWLCVAMGAPALICKMVSQGAPAVSPNFFSAMGLPVGSQIPNARRFQKILWADDGAAEIIAAVHELEFVG